MEKKKELYLELVYDIPTLIKLQEYSLSYLKKTERNPDVLDFQEDVLRCLRLLNQIDFINIDKN